MNVIALLTGADVDIDTIRQLVRARRYQVKLHAVQHALQEGFGEREMVAAILTGDLIETYPERNRVLICGKAMFAPGLEMYLHVVCEQNYPDQVEFVTAYVPNRREWTTPPVKRKDKKP
jgi:hypothetical protein